MNHANANSGNPIKLTTKFSAKKFFNLKAPQDEGTVGAAFGSDPAEQAYFQVWICNHAGGLEIDTGVNVSVRIEYIALLQEPRYLSGS